MKFLESWSRPSREHSYLCNTHNPQRMQTNTQLLANICTEHLIEPMAASEDSAMDRTDEISFMFPRDTLQFQPPVTANVTFSYSPFASLYTLCLSAWVSVSLTDHSSLRTEAMSPSRWHIYPFLSNPHPYSTQTQSL